MSQPLWWMGYLADSASGAHAGWAAASGASAPAVCIALDDLPASGANKAQFRRTRLCDTEGNSFYAYVLMTEPVSGG